MFFNEYPYRNLTDLNLDWILKQIKDLTVNLEDFVKLNTVKYADPIDWDISRQYEANTVVVNEFTGVAYLSTKPVPSGVDVTNIDYWTPIFTLDFVNMNKNITLRNDGNNNNATFASVVGDWLIVGGQLYKVIQDIGLHTAYVVGYNIQIYSVELFVRDYLNQIITLVGSLDDLTTSDKTNIVNAINSVLDDITDIIGDLNNLTTINKTNIVEAINSVNAPEHVGYVTPQMFGAIGDDVNDDTTAIQNAINYAQNNGIGLVYIPKGTYKTTKPLVVPYGVNLTGASEYESTIHKTTNGTIHLNITNPTYEPEVYIDTTVPDDVNAILVLTNDNGRYCGTIRNIGFVGDFANDNNYESQIVDIGIFSTGSLSDFRLENCYIDCVRHGFLCQTIFVATIINNRIDHCLRGIGINNTSTSLFLSGNFVARARDYAYYLRSLFYSQISNNAADYFNYPTYYSDRTVQRACYTFRSCFNVLITNNGCEQCIGIAYRFLECKGCTVDSNTALRLGSDYSGSGDIAFLYFNNNIQRCKIRNNIAYFYDSNGLIFGNAVAAKHHNIFFEGLTYVSSNEIENNIFSSTIYGVIQDEGWGNVVAPNINSVYGGRSFITALPTLRAESTGDLNIVYGSNNIHYVENNGKFKHVFGCFDVTLTYTTASGYLIINSMPTNSAIDWRINVTGIESSIALTKQLKGFRLNGNSNSGIAFADDESIFRITDIPSGAHLLIYYDAYYLSANDI